MILDTLLPAYDFRERHSLYVRSTPENIYKSLHTISPPGLPLLRLLMGLRGLPETLFGRKTKQPFGRSTPLLTQIVGTTFFVVGDSPNQELVLGTIGQFWKLRGGEFRSFASPQEFQSFNESGFAKAGLNFFIERTNEHHCRISTETRILCTDPASRRKFRLYWFIIRIGSGLIRHEFLRAIRKTAYAKNAIERHDG
jgi:hypothetical protein